MFANPTLDYLVRLWIWFVVLTALREPSFPWGALPVPLGIWERINEIEAYWPGFFLRIVGGVYVVLHVLSLCILGIGLAAVALVVAVPIWVIAFVADWSPGIALLGGLGVAAIVVSVIVMAHRELADNVIRAWLFVQWLFFIDLFVGLAQSLEEFLESGDRVENGTSKEAPSGSEYVGTIALSVVREASIGGAGDSMKQNDPPPEQENPVEIVSPSTPAMETSQRPEKMGFWQTRYETIREADRAELREQRLKNMKLENETGREVIENKNLQHELKNLPRTHELRDQEVALAEEKLELERREIARRRVQLEADQKDEAELAKLKAAAEKLDAEIKLQQKKMQLKRAQHAAEQVGKPPKERSLTEAIDRRAAKAKIDKKAESHKKAIPGLEDEFDRAAQKDKDALIDE